MAKQKGTLPGMDFTDQSLSIQLYNYLCQKIGTEDVIRTRRAYYTSLDYVTDNGVQISSGSKGEGLDMKGSDLDIMYVNKKIEIFETCEESTENSFFIDMDDCKPGFTQLKQLNSKLIDPHMKSWCEIRGKYFIFSNEIFKAMIVAPTPIPTIVHGPCISDPNEEFDFAFCFRCRTWIANACPWLHRNRYWPSLEQESKIASYGVLFVPIGCKGSKKEDLEWRISFSVAEKQLIYSFTHVQLLCYVLLKIILKELVDKTTCKGLLCSYFLKTVIFWVLEENPMESWRPEKLLSNFRVCLRRLLYFVESSFLPHYFISENNLFECRFDAVQHSCLIETLSYHYQNLIFGFRESETMADFFLTSRNSPRCLPISGQNRYCEVTNTLARLTRHPIFRSNMFNLLRCISLFRNFSLKPDGFIFLLHFSKFESLYGFMQICRNEGSNKCQYDRQRKYLPYVVIGLPGDSVLGWMYLATYFYCSKQYNKCLRILGYALSKCTPGKLYSRNDRMAFDELEECDRKSLELGFISDKDIYGKYVLSPILFSIEYNTVPVELIELIRRYFGFMIPPKVYCQFLIFLCIYHLYDDEECEYALNDLNRTVKKMLFIDGSIELAVSLNCLGICYFINGDLDAAELAFRKSLEFDARQESFVSYMLTKIQNKKR